MTDKRITTDLAHLRRLWDLTRGYGDLSVYEKAALDMLESIPALLDAADERDRLKADLAVRDENYGTLLQRWKDACQDVAILRAENQRLADDPKAY